MTLKIVYRHLENDDHTLKALALYEETYTRSLYQRGVNYRVSTVNFASMILVVSEKSCRTRTTDVTTWKSFITSSDKLQYHDWYNKCSSFGPSTVSLWNWLQLNKVKISPKKKHFYWLSTLNLNSSFRKSSRWVQKMKVLVNTTVTPNKDIKSFEKVAQIK